MIDWKNDNLFFTHTWIDETSMYDPSPSCEFSPGNDCYMRRYSCRVPLGFKDSPSAIEKFIDDWIDTEEKGFWVEVEETL